MTDTPVEKPKRVRKAKVQNSIASAPINNSLAQAIGYSGIPGFPANQGSAISKQITSPETIFENMRWYFVSNFRQMLSQAYVEIGLIQTICGVPVEDALKGGIEIKTSQLSPEEIEQLNVDMDREDDLQTAGQAGIWNRLYGGAGILVLTDQDPREPLNVEAIGPDTPLNFKEVDMWELFWSLQNTTYNDLAFDSDAYEFYDYYGESVHKSRVFKIKGLKAPSFLRPRLRGWGFSVVEKLVSPLNQYLKSTDLSFEVMDEFKLDVYKIKNLVDALLSPIGTQKIMERVQLGNWQKNFQNALVMDSEDDFDHKQLSFSGLAETMQQIRLQIASAMRMPLTKIFGISASGFNSGEDDIEVYNAMVEAEVRAKLKKPILQMVELRCQKRFGFIPDDLSIKFKPLRELSSEQEENVKTQKFNRILQAVQTGQMSAQEFRDACNKDGLLPVELKDNALMDMPGAGPDDVDAVGDDDGEQDAVDDTDGEGLNADELESALISNSGDWEESKHPRADDGKFSTSDGGGTAKAEESATDKSKDEAAKLEKKRISGKLPSDKKYSMVSSYHVEDLTIHGGAKSKQCAHCGKEIRSCVDIEAGGGDKYTVGIDCAEALLTGEAKTKLEMSVRSESAKQREISKIAKGVIKSAGGVGKDWEVKREAYRKIISVVGEEDKKILPVLNLAVRASFNAGNNGRDWYNYVDKVLKPEAKPEAKPEDTETIEVGPDGDYSTDLTDEQVALAKDRFREASHGPQGKNPSTETPEEQSERTHELERKTREKSEKELEAELTEDQRAERHFMRHEPLAKDEVRIQPESSWRKRGDKLYAQAVVGEDVLLMDVKAPEGFKVEKVTPLGKMEKTTARGVHRWVNIALTAIKKTADKLGNSIEFDRRAFELDKGDPKLFAKRAAFFRRPKDEKLFTEAKRRSEAIFGEYNAHFAVWYYERQGGKFW